MCLEPTVLETLFYFCLMIGLSFFSLIASVVLLITGVRWQKYFAAGSFLLILFANGFFVWICIETESPQGPLVFPVFNLLISLPLFIAQLILMVMNNIESRRCLAKASEPMPPAGT